MKIALAQLNYHIGNFESNTNKIIEAINKARNSGAELVVFAELSITGYAPRDFLEFDEFIENSEKAIKKIAEHTTDIGVIIGAPVKNNNPKGKPLYNAALFIHNKIVKSEHHKALLPNYDVFDEYRYFEPGKEFSIIEFKGKRIALTICEDIWNLTDQPLYTGCPMDYLKDRSPDLMINIAASPFDVDHHEDRLRILNNNVSNYNTPIIYVNHVGAQTELIFDGGSMVMNKKGQIVEQLAFFKEDFKIVDTADLDNTINDSAPEKTERIHKALVSGIKDYFDKLGFKKALVGLSGGIDSAVTATLAAEALGPSNVLGVLMPSEFSSDHSIEDALSLAENLGIKTHTLQINNNYESIMDSLAPVFKDAPFGLAEENIQARIRGTLLMALSNKFGGIVLNTSNKSEAAVGYGTLYGDMVGGLSVLGDVYKTCVVDLAQQLNKKKELIPHNTITKPPSAELRPDQKDSDSLPDYDLLDKILELYIEKTKGRADIIEMGYDAALVKKILKLVNINEYKRHQAPPILRISKKAFGMGRRMPIVARYLV
ncbi:MAG: NAD+ synthase [Bacteroidetes bacterium]|nr:MAG: NAD+ synthase [Bacteroidota bacterium]